MALPTPASSEPFGRLHRPASAAPSDLPALVLIHDVWGPSEHSEALAADLASEGFAVLEIDLYRSMGGGKGKEKGRVEIEAPGPFIRSLRDADILADLDAASDWLAQQPGIGARHAVVGTCMGGTYALLAACGSDRFAAAATFYGILSYDQGLIADPAGRDHEKKPKSPLEAAPDLRMPLLASFGASDDFIPLDQVDALRGILAGLAHATQVDVYADAGHAFLNRTRADAYSEAASAAAWAQLIPFLREHL